MYSSCQRQDETNESIQGEKVSQTQKFGGKLGSNFEGQKVFQSTVFCFHEALLTY